MHKRMSLTMTLQPNLVIFPSIYEHAIAKDASVPASFKDSSLQVNTRQPAHLK